jgi:hypothetical protein
VSKKVSEYKDCIVTREEVISCGADWKERLKKGLPAGEKRQVVSVVRKHKKFDEVLLPSSELYQEAKENTWGGPREGAGRPSTGRKRKQFYITDEEEVKLKEYLEELRK